MVSLMGTRMGWSIRHLQRLWVSHLRTMLPESSNCPSLPTAQSRNLVPISLENPVEQELKLIWRRAKITLPGSVNIKRTNCIFLPACTKLRIFLSADLNMFAALRARGELRVSYVTECYRYHYYVDWEHQLGPQDAPSQDLLRDCVHRRNPPVSGYQYHLLPQLLQVCANCPMLQKMCSYTVLS